MRLITPHVEADLLYAAKLGERPPEQTPVVMKLSTPDASATWFVLEGEQLEDGDWWLFAFCDLGDPQCAELGYVLLSQLQAVRGVLGLPVERDLFYMVTFADVFTLYDR